MTPDQFRRLKAASAQDPRLFSFISSLGFADNMSDVADDVAYLLRTSGLGDVEWDDLSHLSSLLSEAGVPTLQGTYPREVDDDGED